MTAAQRVQAALAAQMKAMTEGVDAVMRAYADRAEALAAVDAADDRLREAVALLAEQGQTSEQIADLTDVPVADLRAARRPKRSGEDPDAAAPVEASVVKPSPGRPKVGDPVPGTRASTYGALDPAVTGTTTGRPASGGGGGQGAGDGGQPSGEPGSTAAA